MRQSRRTFLRTMSLAAAAGVAGGSLQSLDAKPGGHRRMRHMCKATFEIEPQFQRGGQKVLELLLLGSGYASFPSVSLYDKFDARAVVATDTVPMEWETNHCYAGNMEDAFGVVSCIARVRGKSPSRSSLVILSEGAPDRLFPGSMVNTLFVDLRFPKLPMQIFNKDPITLRGKVRNLDVARDLRVDPRAKESLRGFASAIRGGIDPGELFEPTGTHRLVSPVRFYLRDAPDTLVATLVASEVQSLPHFGLDITHRNIRRDGRFVNAEFLITNLTEAPVELVWYVDDSHDLTIVSQREGRASVGANGNLAVPVQAVNNQMRTDAERACIFCGAHNTPATLEAFRSNPISGFTLLETGREL